MATPITAGAIVFEARKLADRRGGRRRRRSAPLLVGLVASLVAGLVAIRFMLRYLRTRSLDIFVVVPVRAGRGRHRRAVLGGS